MAENLLKLEKRIIELEKQKTEQISELERNKRLAFLGEMATAIAYQINQPVSIIRALTGPALTDQNQFQQAEVKPLLSKIWRQTEHLQTMINTFRQFAQGDRTIREAVNLNTVIQSTIELFIEQFKQYHIELIIQLIEPAPIAHTNPFLLQEILIHLLTNARDALEHRPQASIWTASWRKDQEVGFQVADNGPGIPESYRSSLFTPSHSTKVAEKGIGLGLYVCDKAIKELGGKIRYQDRSEGGACFIVALPQLTESSVKL